MLQDRAVGFVKTIDSCSLVSGFPGTARQKIKAPDCLKGNGNFQVDELRSMTISQQIVQSLRTVSQVSNSGEEEDEIFDIDEHLRSSSKKILLQKIDFVEAKLPYHFNLKTLKSKYVLLNPNQDKTAQKSTATMSPALKINSPSTQSASHDGIPPPKTVLFSADKVELNWKKAMRAGAGLANLGNTCFLNSALQCLAYTAPLANYLTHLDHRKQCCANGQFCMLCAMQQHIYYIHSNSGQAIKPMYILKNLRMIAKHLRFGRQEDAHEFIRYSVDAMQKSCLFGYSSKIDVHIKATTAVHQIFGGYLRSRVRCAQCKCVSDTYDPFLDLSLDISKQGCVNLQRCLEMFVRAEVLQGDNAYKCIQCKSTVQACKKFSIHRPPNVLTLQLKRFSNFMGNKINKDLTYPSKLNIEPYMSTKLDGGYWYELYAVLVHSGFTCQSGHYYAYAKAPNGQWYCFNDSSVHQVGVNQALNQQAYLLFYSRNPKASVQLGHLKQSLNKNLHSSSTNSKVHPSRGSNITNGNGKAQTQELMHRPRIGPQLPANFKREKDRSFPSTSSGSPARVQCNQPKVIASPSMPRPSSSINSDRKPLQFSLNQKHSKLADVASSTLKLTNGVKGQNHSSMTKARSFVQNGTQKSLKVESKSSTLPGTNSSGLRSPILDKFFKDSSEPGTSASSASTSRSSLSASSVSNGISRGLKPLVSYSSEDSSDDDNDYDIPLQSDYTSLTSTLKKLRREAITPSSLVTPRKENGKNTIAKEKNATKSGLKNAGSKTPSQSAGTVYDERRKNDKPPSNGHTKKPEFVKSHTKGAFDIVQAVSGPAQTDISRLPQGVAAADTQRESSSQREPILHLLNNEIENGLNGEESSGKFEVKNTKKNDVFDLAQKLFRTKKDDEKVKVNGYGKENERNKLGDHHRKSPKERKHHHSTESTSFASPRKGKNGQNKHHLDKPQKRSPSPTRPAYDRKSETPTKKRKRDKSDKRHYSDGYTSDDSYHGRREKHQRSRKEGRESPLRRKKHERKESRSSSLERNYSKSNGKSSEDSGSGVERLYCDKEEFEQSLRRKSKKDKKRRLREREILQHSIDEESPKYDRQRSLSSDRQREGNTNGIENAHEHTHDSSKSHGAKRHHEHNTGNHHHEKKAKKDKSHENGKVHKKDGKRDGDSDDRKSATKDRPNILQQLLKQSSGKAYGAKVDTWNGEESLVEKDAQRTWSELRTPLTDDWDKEYDKGKVKKHKKKDHHKTGAMYNIFQKFQNMKNHRNGM